MGQPGLSSGRVHEIVDRFYNASRAGIPGNDDSGAMSSRLAFYMMGFYPNAGFPYYLITAPYFKRTTIHLENGKDFIIEAKNLSDKNCYIKSAKLNGKPFNQAWIYHNQISEGGSLFLEMTNEESEWGATNLPPIIH
jgi:putative alpha-1,2-mannosidase